MPADDRLVELPELVERAALPPEERAEVLELPLDLCDWTRGD